jgi:hypothetical protein
MRGVSQRTKDMIAWVREILAEDQPGAFGAYSLAGWSTLPQVDNPNQGSQVRPNSDGPGETTNKLVAR